MEFNLSVGLSAELSNRVGEKDTAIEHGSGSVAVYATPAMIGLMEGAAMRAAAARLPEGWTTVGTNLSVCHIAATPLGLNVRATAELVEIEGKKLKFNVRAFDEKEKIGEGTHERCIVQIDRFVQRAQSKRQ